MTSYKEGVTIVTIVLPNGAEIVGRYTKTQKDQYILYKPRLVQAGESALSFVSGICMTGATSPIEVAFKFTSVMFMVETDPTIANAWREATGTKNVIVPEKSPLIM